MRIIKFLVSPPRLVLYLCIALAMSVICNIYGIDRVWGVFVSGWQWLRGGEYPDYAVLSTAFAVNTWGLAVRTLQRRVRNACRIQLVHTTNALRNSRSYMYALEHTNAQNSKKASSRINAFYCCLCRYDKMTPSILEISSSITSFLMGVCACISVMCMIFCVKGRFSTFLLLPYPLFWLYGKAVPIWVCCVLKWHMIWLRISFPMPKNFTDGVQTLKNDMMVLHDKIRQIGSNCKDKN